MENKIKIEDLKKDLFIGDLGEYFCDYYNGYICDIVCEIADNKIDIYYSDLFEWAKHNYDIIEEANELLGTPNDMIKQIQQGQAYYNERDLYDNLKDIVLFRLYDYIEKDLDIKELTEEQVEEIEFLNINDNDELLENLIEETEKIVKE